jgi:hypothetical protein
VGVHTDTACNVNSPYTFLRNGPYDPHINRWSFLGYREVHATMLANGDNKPIWMTELGWNTSSAVCDMGKWAGQKAGGVSLDAQATNLREAYHCLAQDPYVQVGIWFGLQDTSPFGSPIASFGLLDGNLARKPAFAALADYARNGDRLTEPCGAFESPSIRVSYPTANSHYERTLPVTVSASDARGVWRISLYGDGRKIRNFGGLPAPARLSGKMVWFGARLLSRGRHVLKVEAIDTNGNTSTVSIVIWHGPAATKHQPHRHGAAAKRHKRHRHGHPSRKSHG